MLTAAEKDACRTAPFRKGLGHGYGSPTEGYCPVGAVAVLRGAVMETDPLTGEYKSFHAKKTADGHIHFTLSPCNERVAQAEKDVLAWTGHANMRTFLAALEGSKPGTIPWVED